MTLVVASAPLAGMALPGEARAATITVTTTTDEDGSGVKCSLREAFKAANTNAAYGGCSAGSSAGQDLIVVNTGGYADLLLTRSASIAVSSRIKLRFDEYMARINGGAGGGFDIASNGELTAEYVVWTGFTTYTPVTVRGSAFFSNVTVFGNSGLPQTMGIYVLDNGYLYLVNSTVKNNTGVKGGGILNEGGDIELMNVTISGNKARQYGGGIMSTSGGWADVSNCTISGNEAVGYHGGGVFNGANSTLFLSSSTVYGNKAKTDGGGVLNAFAEFGIVYLRHTILSNNLSANGSGCIGRLYSNGGNMRRQADTCDLYAFSVPAANPDRVVTDVGLDALASPAPGFPAVHTPKSTSPAINKITTTYCQYMPPADQLGTKRPQYSLCDVGSVERR